jgi:cytochrome c biogenesis protein CcmG, thiol:disulfide interchange protein DsbE
VPARRVTAQIVALAAVAVMLIVLIWHLTHQPRHASIGAAAPTFVLQRLDRDGILDLSALRGKPVVLNFWASWCGPCKREAATLERTWQRYRKQGLVLVGVDVNDADSDARRFMRAHGVTYPVVRDPNGSIAANSYNVADLPMTFFVDKRGRLVGTRIRGAVGAAKFAADFRSGLQAALGS